jgi:hypothetical protein
MRSSYNFQSQIDYLNDVCQTNITLAESANNLLSFIPKAILSKIVQ